MSKLNTILRRTVICIVAVPVLVLIQLMAFVMGPMILAIAWVAGDRDPIGTAWGVMWKDGMVQEMFWGLWKGEP